MKALLLLGAAAALTLPPLVDPDVLEPSVENEVVHALDKAAAAPTATNAVTAAMRAELERLLGTNAPTATAVAVRLVSIERQDGRWLVGTNDVTAAAVERLRELLP